MATELGQAYVQIIPSAKGIKGSIQKTLDPESNSAGKSAGSKIVSGIKGIIVTAGIGKALSSALTQGADLQQSIGGIETLFKDSAGKMQEYASEAYKTVGVSANEYMENVTSFSASLLQSLGGDTETAADKANMAMIDMGDNANKMGTSMESIQNAYQGFAKQNYTMLDNLKLGYGGTKTEMERLLADATKLTGVEYDISNLSDVYSAVHAIQQEMGITGTTAKEAKETVTGSLNAMKSSFKDLVGVMITGGDWGMAMSGFSESLMAFLGNIGPMIEQFIRNIPIMVVSFLEQAGPQLIASGMDFISNIVTGMGRSLPDLIPRATEAILILVQTFIENVPMMIQSGLDLIMGLIQGITNAIPLVIQKIPELINGLLTGISENYSKIMETGIKLFTSLIEGLPTIISNIVNKLPEILNSITNYLNTCLPLLIDAGVQLLTSLVENLPLIIQTIVTALPKIIDSIINFIISNVPLIIKAGIELFTALITNLPTIIMTIVNAIPQIIEGIINALFNNIPEIVMAGVDLLTSIITNLPQIIKTIVTSIPQIITGIVSALGKGVSALANVGLDLIKGLWNGIKDAGKWLMDKIKGWASGIIDGVKDFFKIGSPSKLFADEIGAMLPAGLAVGVEANTKPVTDAMDDLAGLTTWSYQDAIPSMEVSGASYSSGNQFAKGYSNDINSLISAINNLANRDVVVAVNGKEIVRQTADDMSMELFKKKNSSFRAKGAFA